MEDEPIYRWVELYTNVANVIDDIVQDSQVTIEICEALELQMRRLEKQSGLQVGIFLNHSENKLYIKTIKNE